MARLDVIDGGLGDGMGFDLSKLAEQGDDKLRNYADSFRQRASVQQLNHLLEYMADFNSDDIYLTLCQISYQKMSKRGISPSDNIVGLDKFLRKEFLKAVRKVYEAFKCRKGDVCIDVDIDQNGRRSYKVGIEPLVVRKIADPNVYRPSGFVPVILPR